MFLQKNRYGAGRGFTSGIFMFLIVSFKKFHRIFQQKSLYKSIVCVFWSEIKILPKKI